MQKPSPAVRSSLGVPALLSLVSRVRRTWNPRLLLPFIAAGAVAEATAGETIYLLNANGTLSSSSTARPAAVATRPLTGVIADETLVAIDVRPQNQKLYALGVNALADTATLYHISPETGHAAAVGTPGSIAFVTAGATPVDFPDPDTVTWDIDFNPAVDRVRVVAGSLNFRVNPNNGAPVDGDLGGASGSVAGTNTDGDVNTGTTTVDGAAYTNSQANNGGITTLYTLDGASNGLYIQNPPNAGTQSLGQAVTLGGNPLDFDTLGFDIPPGVNAAANNAQVAGLGYALLNVGGTTALYTVNLTNANATLVGGSFNARSFAIRTELGQAISLSADAGSLVRYSVAAPDATTTVAITGIVAGETLVGIDTRPQTGELMGLGVNATTDTATLYRLDPQTGAATVIGAAGGIAYVDGAGDPVDLPDPAASGWGFDFNPTVDRVRVVTSTGLNLRVNPNNGAAVDGDGVAAGINPDGSINSDPVLVTGVSGTAYTNAFGRETLPSGVTTQYTLDDTTNSLYIQNPPNNGTQTVGLPVLVGGNPADFGSVNGFDIPSAVAVSAANEPATGEGWFAATIGANTGLYRINLGTGVAQLAGAIGDGTAMIQGLTVNASPSLSVEDSEGDLLITGTDTIDFGSVAPNVSDTLDVTVRNTGSQALTYTASVAGDAEFTVTAGGSGTVAPGGTGTITVTFAPTATGSFSTTLSILNNDPAVPAFEVDIDADSALALGDDALTNTSGPTRLNVLANDNLSPDAIITMVSDAAIIIDGRSLIIPANFVGTFTYTVSDGGLIGTGSVTVTAGTPAVNPATFNGLLLASDDSIVGSATVTVSSKNVATISLVAGTVKVKAKATLPDTVGTAVSVYTNLGYLTVTKTAQNTVTLSISALGGSVSGTLLPAVTTATATKYHIALASIQPGVPGGGYAIATVSKKGAIKVTGLLPDGVAFSGATGLRDNGTFPIYSVVTKAKPPAFVGGELVTADLAQTDVSGELFWVKFPQLPKVKGLHLDGVNTVLTANGSVYDGTALGLEGATATLTLSGGNLAAPEVNPVVVGANGIPAVPVGSLTKWSGVNKKVGKFSAQVTVPGLTKPAKGSGLYLPKSASAWGFFPGTTVGGRIDLRD